MLTKSIPFTQNIYKSKQKHHKLMNGKWLYFYLIHAASPLRWPEWSRWDWDAPSTTSGQQGKTEWYVFPFTISDCAESGTEITMCVFITSLHPAATLGFIHGPVWLNSLYLPVAEYSSLWIHRPSNQPLFEESLDWSHFGGRYGSVKGTHVQVLCRETSSERLGKRQRAQLLECGKAVYLVW